MRIVTENMHTDAKAGMIALEDDQGKVKRYVRRNRNVPIMSGKADLVWVEGQPLACANTLNGKNLPDRLTVGLSAGNPTSGALTSAEFVGAHGYEADEEAYWVWEKCRDMALTGNPRPNPDEVRKLLDDSDPKPFGEPWKIDTVVKEIAAYLKDKGERV